MKVPLERKSLDILSEHPSLTGGQYFMFFDPPRFHEGKVE